MDEYIPREAAYEKCGWYNTVNGKSVCAARKDELAAIPAADVAPVVPELRKVVDLLNEEYEKAMQNTFINNPLAYALYRVWKDVDGGKNGR